MPTTPSIEPHGIGATMQAVVPYYYNTATNQYELCRTPTESNTAQVSNSGDTVVWTPAAGKKFRLLGYTIGITGNSTLAVAGITTLTFKDASNSLGIAHDIWLPSLALTSILGLVPIPPVTLPGNGLLSAAANNTLICNLSTAINGGKIRVTCFGCEE